MIGEEMIGASSVKFKILALILAVGKTEFEGELEDALNSLFLRHLDLLPEPTYLRHTPGRLTFETELRSLLFNLDAFSWTHHWTGRGSYVTHYRIENLPKLQQIVEDERRKDPETVAKFEALAPEFEQELDETVRHRESLVIDGPDDYP